MADNKDIKIIRIDSDREEKSCNRLSIEIAGQKFTLTERFGALNVHYHGSEIIIRPCVGNEIDVTGSDL